MKKIILFLALVCFFNFSYADQYESMTKEQAEKVLDFVNSNKISKLCLYCGCCNDGIWNIIKIEKLYMKKSNIEGRYEIVLIGSQGGVGAPIDFNSTIDIAYTYIPMGETLYNNLAKVLKWEAYLCGHDKVDFN